MFKDGGSHNQINVVESLLIHMEEPTAAEWWGSWAPGSGICALVLLSQERFICDTEGAEAYHHLGLQQ